MTQRPERIRVVIADDHAVLRRGLRAVLRSQSEFDLVGEASSFGELRQVVALQRPDVAIVDLRMPGGDAAKVIQELVGATPPVAVVVFTSAAQTSLAREVIHAGASGFVLKSSGIEELTEAVRAAASARSYIDASLETDIRHRLTPRELQTLRMLAQGRTSEQVAVELGIGVKSVEKYRARVRDKLGVNSPMAMVRAALRLGLIGSS